MPYTSDKMINVKEASGTRVALEAGANVFFSLTLLIKAEKFSGYHDWVYRTASSLSSELRMNHFIVFEGLHYVVQPDQSMHSFPEYIHQLSIADPVYLRQKMFDVYMRIDCTKWDSDECYLAEPKHIDPESVLGSTEDYFRFLETHFGPGYMNVEIEKAAYKLVIDPPAMQKFIVAHMWRMWEEAMAKEWRRVEPLLQETVEAFQQINLQELSRTEAMNAVLNFENEMEFEKIKRKLEHVQQVIFVPSAHIGPYQMSIGQDIRKWMFFPVHSPKGLNIETPNLNNAEILVRLAALNDETRLRILQTISTNGPLTSSEVMERLGLSQSAASRHLMQLSATGYLNETRVQGAKQYAINPSRIDETMQAVAALLHKR